MLVEAHGPIKNCLINNISINIEGNNSALTFGGIINTNSGIREISSCTVNNVSLNCANYLGIAGIVGVGFSNTITDCIVNELKMMEENFVGTKK